LFLCLIFALGQDFNVIVQGDIYLMDGLKTTVLGLKGEMGCRGRLNAVEG